MAEMKNGLGACLILSLFVLCGAAWPQMESYGDIQVASSDENGITFNYFVPEPQVSRISLAEGDFDLVDIDRCAILQEPGSPRLPVKVVGLGVPPGSQVEVMVSAVGTALRSLNIAPIPGIERDEGAGLGYRYNYSAISGIYSENAFFPDQMVRVSAPSSMHSQEIVKLLIFPVQFNPQARLAQVHRQLTIRVNFIGGEKDRFHTTFRDLFENIYKKTLLNYEQAKTWRRTTADRVSLKSKQGPFDYSDRWYKIETAEDGIYCLTRSDLTNAGITGNVDTDSIRIFNAGGRALPVSNDSAYLELKEIPLWIKDKDGDGRFEADDSIFFYGWSCSGWDYDSTKTEFRYYLHPYAYNNVFWLSVEGDFPNPAKRMDEKTSLQGEFPIHKSASREHVEANSVLKATSEGYITNYHIWYWTTSDHLSRSKSLSDLKSGETHKVNIKADRSASNLYVNGSLAQKIGTEPREGDIVSKFESSDFNDQTLQVLDIYFSGSAYFDWYEIEYTRWLKLRNGNLFLESPDTEGVAQYNISNRSSSSVWVFDVSDRFEVKRFEDTDLEYVSPDTVKFQDSVGSDEKKQYYILEGSRLKRPLSIYSDEHSSWRNVNHQADMLIITPEAFSGSIGALADFRRRYNHLWVEVVNLQDIYDEFSGGLADPVAIRDFLKYAFHNWTEPSPAFVLLAGDGHYDHKNYMETGAPLLIPCFTAYGGAAISDEYYVYFGAPYELDSDSSGEVDMVISRLPVNSENQLEASMEKIIAYEEYPDFGPWRNRIALVADDEFGQGNNETYFTAQSEDLWRFRVPSTFDMSKIYLVEYPFNSVREKPGATQDIVDAFQQGALMINWIGHGNPDLWAHEHVLTRDRDIPKLISGNTKLPLVFAATCEVGYYVSPFKQSLGEELFTVASKGAVAVIAASDKVTPGDNFALNSLFYQFVLDTNRLSIGEALFCAKFLCKARSYVLFGDPVSKLGSPRLAVNMDVNPDTLSALSLMEIKGQVQDSLGSPDSGFVGTATIHAFDSRRNRTYEAAGGNTVNYELPGRTLFRGTAQVEKGSFSVQFVVPKDIGYGGNTARISAYVSSQEIDGAGSAESLVVSGSETTVVDNQGPQIKIGFSEQEGFREEDHILPNAVMKVIISDENGINLTGELGHGITLDLDDQPTQTDLTDLFQYNAGSYTTGSLHYQLPTLSEGEHVFKIKAWDSANNATLFITKAKVKSSSGFKVLDLMNYPNPFSEQTRFSYMLTDQTQDVRIEIFTLAGRLIRTLYNASGAVGYNFETVWDGRDQDGDRAGNGVYIYKVEATSVHKVKAEGYGKAIVMH